MNNANLILEDGTVFPGESFGAKSRTNGEVVLTQEWLGILKR